MHVPEKWNSDELGKFEFRKSAVAAGCVAKLTITISEYKDSISLNKYEQK